MRMLTVEKPYEEIQYMPWDDKAIQLFNLNQDETDLLNAGAIVWRGPVAFSLDEEEK